MSPGSVPGLRASKNSGCLGKRAEPVPLEPRAVAFRRLPCSTNLSSSILARPQPAKCLWQATLASPAPHPFAGSQSTSPPARPAGHAPREPLGVSRTGGPAAPPQLVSRRRDPHATLALPCAAALGPVSCRQKGCCPVTRPCRSAGHRKACRTAAVLVPGTVARGSHRTWY